MSITRAQIARQLLAQGGVSLNDAQMMAPDGEFLAYINPKEKSFIISGTGDVLEPEGDVIGIGSGGNYALAAGKVLMEGKMSAEEVAKKAIKVAADICFFTNDNVKIEKI